MEYLTEPVAPATPTQVTFPANQAAFAQCNAPFKQDGLFPSPIDGGICINLPGDLLTLPFDILKYLISAVAGGDEAVDDIVDQAFAPAEFLLELAFEKLLEQFAEDLTEYIGEEIELGFEAGACIGNFLGSDVTDDDNDDMLDICKEMPLATQNDAEWSIFAAGVTIPPPVSGMVCEGITNSITISACLAISTCDLLPSVAFYMDSGILSCLIGQAGVETSGVATAIGYAIELGFDHYGFGYSITNAFEIELAMYNGYEIFEYTASPTVFDTISFALDSEKLHESLEGFFVFSGTQTRGISINSPQGGPADYETTKQGIANFDAKSRDEHGQAEDGLVNQFDQWTVQMFMKGQVGLEIGVSEIPYIGNFFENMEMDLGQINSFLSTGDQTVHLGDGSTKEVYAGLSFFMGLKAESMPINQLIDFIFGSINGLLVRSTHSTIDRDRIGRVLKWLTFYIPSLF